MPDEKTDKNKIPERTPEITTLHFNPKLGANQIAQGDTIGVAYQGVNYTIGRLREEYNPSTGRFELIDERGRAVGYVPGKGYW